MLPTMDNSKLSVLFEWCSYILIVAATILFFAFHKNVPITLLILLVALICRVLMYRHRFLASENENESLRTDLHRLTLLLKQNQKSTDK